MRKAVETTIYLWINCNCSEQSSFIRNIREMFAFQSVFLYETIWRIRHTEEIRSVFEVGSE